MVLSEDGDDCTEQRYEELCLDLNMDRNAKDEAWQSYERIRTNYTLEGDTIHWLACALYVSCRKSVVPTVGARGLVQGNYVSLTRLLRSAKLSLIQFFNKMKKWSDMANLPQEFRDKVDRLERNFAVSTVIFKKFQPIFLDIFRNPADDPPRQQRSRKQRRLPCTVSDVFAFCWTMFVQVKGNFPAISDDLVNSYHLLLCCNDWFYANALLSNRKDLLSPGFSGLPDEFSSRDFRAPTEVPCIIELLCEKHEGLVLEAKGIKEHWWKPYIKKLFDKKILKGKAENLAGILDIGSFESNSKAINNAYEEYVLNVGDFDERIFLGEEAGTEIGTPAKSQSTGELEQRVQVKKNLQQYFDKTKTLCPSTPLTGRRYLKEKEANITPVSTATQSVSRLQSLLSGRKTCPSDTLLEIFSECQRNPKDDITGRVKEMGDVFCVMYAQPSDDHPGSQQDFAKKRLQLGESLYYKTLENIMLNEGKRLGPKDKKAVFSNLLEQDTFHRSLFACCLEIVIFSYNSQRTFPWIVDTFNLSPYYFYKVIEVLVRAEDGLSRDVVKHLNHIEETILESLAWKAESPIWDAIKAHSGGVPSCEEVTLPNQIDREGAEGPPQIMSSPIIHPAVKRIAGEGRAAMVTRKGAEPLQSPTGPSVSDRFNSPTSGSAKRKLFATTSGQGQGTSLLSPPPGSAARAAEAGSGASENSTSPTQPQQQMQRIITFQQAQTEDGRQVLIPVQIIPASATPSGASSGATTSVNTSSQQKTKRAGSLGLFFRKIYHLASVRLRDLCEKLDVDSELRKKMWTCFEHVMVNHIDLMMDRHLDQLVMCAVYVMAKVTGNDRSFQDIMKCYRLQPQAQSHVYRSVLLSSRRRRTSGSSDSSKNGASGSSSPVNVEKDEKEKEKKRAERLSTIRSSSTLPVPHPNSQPPTPTRLAGTASYFEFEDRGDLIKFYNSVYVKKTKDFALKFSVQNRERGTDIPPLSPLPMVRSHPQSPRRVSSKHCVYVSPHKARQLQMMTPNSRMLYCFNRSPAKDLQAINNMLRMGDKKGPMNAGKRLLVDDDGPDSKRLCTESTQGPAAALTRRLEAVSSERQEANGTR